ncbi:alkene reductase [Micromonospora avicenniae]|uniref:2,4-dienoyl-CoA reductase n=1 Tax=Micromonospora avicenniae TaxID=1198245 RepID=A0A1N7A0B0_9ACTN|nr:alkene reductase [Micromonospora avicenniae]SIR32468.1 2,4-dienoyl-CoA reductase [Micromonospora avicenniae]
MDLFTPTTLGALTLKNRLVMAPMTRLRADAAGVPTDLQGEYYAQRAGFGLVITEGAYPSHESRAYPYQPGIVTRQQRDGWRRVADTVHASGGTIVMQLMHAGRVSHLSITGTERIVAPSGIALTGDVHTAHGKWPYPTPHALAPSELPVVRDEFVAAAQRAIDAGLDGVELHAGNGYLLHQFLAPSANHRTDEYGGDPRARARFVVEVASAVAEQIGGSRVGIRLSPAVNIQGALETDHTDLRATYDVLADGLAPLGLAYLSVVHVEPASAVVQRLRARVGAPLIVNTGFSVPSTREESAAMIAEGIADAVVVGRPAIANPDLVERWRHDLPETQPDPATFYTGGASGYTDYPPCRAAVPS